ncbi:SP_0009 family protein [Streptococcus pseudoporcinus]|nr:SP_0009 family protein [Streptococcus pseudoporcinus]
MEDIVKKIETFLSFSEEKLEELKKENQALKEEMFDEN